MRLQFIRTLSMIFVTAFLSIANTGCQSKSTQSKDAEIKATLEARFKNDSIASKISVAVKDSVVTLTGECANDDAKEYCTQVAETIPYVRSVINNCTVTGNSDDYINKKIYEIIADYPYIKIGTMNGIVAVAGSLKKEEWQKLKTYVDKLHPKGYDTTMLRVE